MIKHLVLICMIFQGVSLFGQNLGYTKDSLTVTYPNFQKTPNWIYADTHYREPKKTYPDSMNLNIAIRAIKSEKDYWNLKPAINWCIDNYESAVPILFDMLLDTTTVGLSSTNGIFFFGRPVEDRLKVLGCVAYEIVRDDIFTVAGRSSHILNKLTNEHFLVVKSWTQYSELQIYQGLWRTWFRSL